MTEYNNPIPVVSVVIPTFDMNDYMGVLLTQRKIEPFIGKWCLPGGYINENEDVKDAASRELFEETGIYVPPISFKVFHTETVKENRLLIFVKPDIVFQTNSGINSIYSFNNNLNSDEVSEISCGRFISRSDICFTAHTNAIYLFEKENNLC